MPDDGSEPYDILTPERGLEVKTLICLIVALAAPAAKGTDILWDVVRVAVGELTTTGNPKAPGAVERRYWGDYEKATFAKDDFGLKELFDSGKMVLLNDKQELLVIEVDTSPIDSLRENMKQVIDIRVGSWRSCMEDNIRRTRVGLPTHECQQINVGAETTKAYQLLQPGVTPETFMDEHLFVRVRVTGGEAKGTACWTRLESLKLPTHKRTDSPSTPQ